MPIRSLGDTAAVARLSSLRFNVPVEEVAQKLAEWQCASNGLLVPIAVPLPRMPDAGGNGQVGASYVDFFRDRARQVRAVIAKALKLDAKKASRLTFTMTNKDAWYLGPRPNLDRAATLAAARAMPAKFIELMLLKELIEAAAFDPDHTFVTGSFGPGVYLGSFSQAVKRRLHMAEARFNVNAKHGLLLCDITSKVFAKKTKGDSTGLSAATLAVDAGEGFMVGVTRIVPDDFFELDSRRYPMVGVSLDTVKIRQSRLYYLNMLAEFALALFEKASVPVTGDTFVATHCVDDGYISLEPLANLRRSLVVVNTTTEPMDGEALKPLARFSEFFPDGYHVAGNKKVHFQPLDVHAATLTPTELDAGQNYLFLNGAGDADHGSIRLAKLTTTPDFQPARASTAYTALARGDSVADPYTQSKFRHLMDRGSVSVAMQGLNFGPSALASLMPGKAQGDDRQLQEAVKRCLVELSLKECLLGHKNVPAPMMPPEFMPSSLTLIATRQIRMAGRQPRKQLVAAVDVQVSGDGIAVERVRRSPWSSDAMAAVDFIDEFPFLQSDGKEWIRDGQFWVIDRATQERLTVWSGTFVPKLILNDGYAGIEAALAAQEQFVSARRENAGGRYYSKSREFNLLPYYMSMYLAEHRVPNERTGTRIPVQDCGTFLRVFVPPEGGINGPGDSLSGMRDVMVYASDGSLVEGALLDRKLAQLFLHTMTNGVLVGGDNSKMSLLEKLASLALEN